MDLPTLPSGILSYDNLAWSQKTWYKKTFHVATIPLNRFADFVEGEGKKADASFALIRTKANVEKEGGKQKIKDEKVYCCCFGPEDNSNNLPPLSKTGPRRRLTEHGEGRKKGCQAEFRAVTYFNDPDQIEIRYVRREHLNAQRLPCHGKDCPAAGAAAYAPSLSADTKKKVQAGLLRQTGARDIVAQIKRDLIQAGEAGMSKDFMITVKDVQNICNAMDVIV